MSEGTDEFGHVTSSYTYDQAGNRLTSSYVATSYYQYCYYYTGAGTTTYTSTLENSTATCNALNRVTAITDPGDARGTYQVRSIVSLFAQSETAAHRLKNWKTDDSEIAWPFRVTQLPQDNLHERPSRLSMQLRSAGSSAQNPSF